MDKALFGLLGNLSLGGALLVFGGGLIAATIIMVLIFLKEKK